MEGKGKEKWPAIGIDLGTTYSCVGVWKHGRVEIIANDQGNRTTPSCVAFTRNQVLVGEAAANQAIQDPTNTIFDAKRLIGRRFDDKSIKSDKNFWPFKVIESPVHNNKPMIAVTYRNQQKQFSAEQISSMILSKMKETAEAYLGSEVKKAVVTVPAYFNDSQRQATKDAGTIAGLDVIRIINEPTAAAIAYGLDNQMVTGTNKVAKNVLVFDLGGGTCDVSLVTIGKRSFEVKAVSGDPHLGGEDFNNRMVQYFVAEIKVKNNKDISNTPRAVKRLRNACEVAKRTLSAANETDIYLECLFDRIDFSEKITRARFEYLNQDLFTECIDLVEKCLKDANMRKDDVDDVVLVGGSSRIVKIQELLKDFFNGKDLCKSINPDEAIAYGAAIQAAKLSDTGNIKDFALVDVIPLSLGIQLYTEEMRVVIPKNTTIPVKKFNDKLVTAEDNQESVTFSIYEGEKEIAKENNFLGKFELCGIPPAPKGEHTLKVSFEIDSNGILTVTAYHEASDKKNQIIITDVRSRLSSAEIEQMIKEAEKCKAEDMEYKKAMKSKLALQEYAEQNQETLRKFNKNKKKLEKAKTAIDNTIQWLDSLDLNSTLCNAREFEVRLKELKYTVDPFTAML